MKILISAAETSSDLHGAQLLRALQRESARNGENVEAFGIGGPKLQAAGLRTIVDARKLLAMGFTEILGRLPQIFGALKEVANAAADEKPDVAVVIDYPDFHFRLAKRLNRLGVPVIYFIPPKVWAWRKGRIRLLRERFVRVLSILPFEVEFYQRENMPVRYVGNPLVDELPLTMTRHQARERLNIAENQTAIVMMPGSRPTELKYHLDLMLNAAALTACKLAERSSGRTILLIPIPQTSSLSQVGSKIDAWKANPGVLDLRKVHELLDIRLSQGNSPECMLSADVGLIKSGTSTLEAGVLECPHAIIYRSNRFSHFIFERVIRRQYKGPVGLVNLVAGWQEGKPLLIREYLEHDQTPEELSAELLSLLGDAVRRAQVKEGLRRVRERVVGDAGGGSPSEVAAREILEWVRGCARR